MGANDDNEGTPGASEAEAKLRAHLATCIAERCETCRRLREEIERAQRS